MRERDEPAPSTPESVEACKLAAAEERARNVPAIGWDVDEDGIVQHEVRKQIDRVQRSA